jgi:hypothetical protein
VQNYKYMALTESQLQNIRKLKIEEKVQILHTIADEFMTVDEFHKYSGMARRTIYDKFGTEQVKGLEFCGHKLIYM